MRFRPCIDIHNGKVKQIVGGSVQSTASGDVVIENFVSNKSASDYAKLFREKSLLGGHVICLDSSEETKQQAIAALRAYPLGLQLGGGVTPENASIYLDAGASHVIVTSYVFHDGLIDRERLFELKQTVGKERLVLDLSCKRVDDAYVIVTNRWQTRSKECVTTKLLDELSHSCDEFLIHAADVEGKRAGVCEDLISFLSSWDGIPITYAGGVSNCSDVQRVIDLGKKKIDLTVGSALDIYGGTMALDEIISLQC